jgi:hypothetical protein
MCLAPNTSLCLTAIFFLCVPQGTSDSACFTAGPAAQEIVPFGVPDFDTTEWRQMDAIDWMVYRITAEHSWNLQLGKVSNLTAQNNALQGDMSAVWPELGQAQGRAEQGEKEVSTLVAPNQSLEQHKHAVQCELEHAVQCKVEQDKHAVQCKVEQDKHAVQCEFEQAQRRAEHAEKEVAALIAQNTPLVGGVPREFEGAEWRAEQARREMSALRAQHEFYKREMSAQNENLKWEMSAIRCELEQARLQAKTAVKEKAASHALHQVAPAVERLCQVAMHIESQLHNVNHRYCCQLPEYNSSTLIS